MPPRELRQEAHRILDRGQGLDLVGDLPGPVAVAGIGQEVAHGLRQSRDRRGAAVEGKAEAIRRHQRGGFRDLANDHIRTPVLDRADHAGQGRAPVQADIEIREGARRRLPRIEPVLAGAEATDLRGRGLRHRPEPKTRPLGQRRRTRGPGHEHLVPGPEARLREG